MREFEANVPTKKKLLFAPSSPSSSSLEERSSSPEGGSSLDQNSIPVSLDPIVSKTVKLFDKFMVSNANTETVEKYNVFKSMMILWNRDASKWATNASLFYREQMAVREAAGTRLDYEAPVERREVESVVEQCGCRRKIMSSSTPEEEAAAVPRNSSMCSLHSLDRGNNQRVRTMYK